MPNRDLKESNRRSPSLQLLSDAAERLWYRLITAVDDFGRLEADPEVVFTTCFQRVPKGWTVQKVTQCLHELGTKAPDGDRPLVTLYEVGKRRYLEIVSAKQHIYQRAKQSKYPSLENQQVIMNCTPLRADARTCTQIPSIPDSRFPNPVITNPEPRIAGGEPSHRLVGTVDNFELTPELEAWAAKKGIPDPGQYVDEFKDYWRSVGGKKKNGQKVVDYPAAFRNHLTHLKATNKMNTSDWKTSFCEATS